MSEAKKSAPKKPAKAPVKKAADTEVFVMKRAGVTEGKSGQKYSHTAGQTLTVPRGEFDHLDARSCEKK